MKRILVHIPHSTTVIPDEYLDRFTISPGKISCELLRMTDRYTDALITWPDKLVFPVSRLVCDVERFREKMQESMTGKGMWVCYTHGSDGRKMKTVDADHEREILERYYDPHHERLAKMSKDHISSFGHCVIVDVHSFPPVPLPYEPGQDSRRPQVCIGADPYHTSGYLKEFSRRFFSDRGYTTAVDRPYSGALTPACMYQKEARLSAVMLELNRSLYMDVESGAKTDGFEKLKACLGEFLAALDELHQSIT